MEETKPRTLLELFSKSEDCTYVSTDRGVTYKKLSEVPADERKYITDFKAKATKKINNND